LSILRDLATQISLKKVDVAGKTANLELSVLFPQTVPIPLHIRFAYLVYLFTQTTQRAIM
jgi:hypothetical protein